MFYTFHITRIKRREKHKKKKLIGDIIALLDTTQKRQEIM